MKKFFDGVYQETLLKILSRRIQDIPTFSLLKEIISSYSSAPGSKIGMPIGNLTSQIFANIYLNELDRFVKHDLKVKAYLRYGDDFIVLENDLEKLEFIRAKTVVFLQNRLKLVVNPRSDKIMKPRHGLKFLGINFWPSGRILTNRNSKRVQNRLNMKNVSSYSGLIRKHGKYKQIRELNWLVSESLLNDS